MLADHFSSQGVPVFLADVKGDLSGIAAAGVADGAKLKERLASTGMPSRLGRRPGRCSGTCSPTTSRGLTRCARPCRDMGPLLLGRAASTSTQTQQGVLQLVFKIADDNGLLLLDLKDLRAMLQYVGDNARAVHQTNYGNVSAARRSARSSAACCRSSTQGGDTFFGEPMLDIADLMQTDAGERPQQGVVNILVADKLMHQPAPVRDVPALDAVGALRAPARGRRPRQAQAGLLLRRGAPALRRGAEGAARRASSWSFAWFAARASASSS